MRAFTQGYDKKIKPQLLKTTKLAWLALIIVVSEIFKKELNKKTGFYFTLFLNVFYKYLIYYYVINKLQSYLK